MKVWFYNPLLLALTMFLFLLLSQKIPLTALFLCSLLWYMRTDMKGAVLSAMLFSMLLLPRYGEVIEFAQGRAVYVAGSYAILQSGRNKVLVYTEEPLQFDSIYDTRGSPQPISSASGFYSFDFSAWAKAQGVTKSVRLDSDQPVMTGRTIRYFLQKCIDERSDGEDRRNLYRLLLNIRMGEEEDSFLYTSGFSYAGMLAVTEELLKYRIDRRKRRKVMLALNVLLCAVYHFPLLLVQTLIFRVLKMMKLEKAQITGFGLSAVMMFRPECVTSMSFLIPASWRLASLSGYHRKIRSVFMNLLIQSICMHRMNPLQNLLYPLMQKCLGLLWLLGLLKLFVPFLPFQQACRCFDLLFGWTGNMALRGSVLGAGLCFYLLLLFTKRHSKSFGAYALMLLLVFQITGLFHPFAEITFINVGQGDSILIRAPLNSCNVLVDTGKPEQWSKLEAMLDAKGIRRINTLIVTHGDNDHAGNVEKVLKHVHTKQVMKEHLETAICGPFVFHDLNTIVNEDENESSLTTYFKLNGMSIMLMGDCDRIAETEIADRYSHLHADILKLSHHGSATGSCDRFLDTVRPDLGIVSSGSYALYHHPSSEVIQRLLQRHIPWLDTKEEGDITVLCLPMVNLLVTSSGKIAIISR